MGLLPEIKGRVNQYYGIKNIRLDPDFSDTAWGFADVSDHGRRKCGNHLDCPYLCFAVDPQNKKVRYGGACGAGTGYGFMQWYFEAVGRQGTPIYSKSVDSASCLKTGRLFFSVRSYGGSLRCRVGTLFCRGEKNLERCTGAGCTDRIFQIVSVCALSDGCARRRSCGMHLRVRRKLDDKENSC